MKIDFEHIKQNYPIVEIALRLGINVNSSNMCQCQFHNDNNPSMSFDTRTNRYKCFACDAKGSNIDLVKNLLHCEVKEACEFITGHSYSNNNSNSLNHSSNSNNHKYENVSKNESENINNINESNIDSNINIYTDFIQMLDNSDATRYLSPRQITKGIIEERQIKNLPKEYNAQATITKSLQSKYSNESLIASGLFAISKNRGNIYNRFFAHRLVIPIVENGQIVSLQARCIDDDVEVHSKYNNLKNNTKIFNIDILSRLAKGSEIIICEGIIDCLSWNRLCFHAIAIGSSGNIGKLDKGIIEKLSKFNIVVAGDADTAGEGMNKKITTLLDNNNIISYNSIDMPRVAKMFNIAKQANDINEILSCLPISTKVSSKMGELEFCPCNGDNEVLFLDYGYISREEIKHIKSVVDIEYLLKFKKAFDGDVELCSSDLFKQYI